MIDKDSIEQAYCFFHQKWRVYAGKSSETQKDDIEYAISSYADSMDQELYGYLAGSRGEGYLREHTNFVQDINHALETLEKLMLCQTKK